MELLYIVMPLVFMLYNKRTTGGRDNSENLPIAENSTMHRYVPFTIRYERSIRKWNNGK